MWTLYITTTKKVKRHNRKNSITIYYQFIQLDIYLTTFLILFTGKQLDSLIIRNAWLSFNGIKVMSKLTNLTLKFVKIDNEQLANFSTYFPSLKVLNLDHIIGLKEPKIHLTQLRKFRFTGYPRSITIQAPNLEELKLRCIQPCLVILKCPSVCNLSISVAKASGISMISIPRNLQKLTLKSLDVPRLLPFFKGTKGLKTLKLEVSPIMSWFDSYSVFSVTDALEIFENVDELIIGPVVWYLWQRSFPSCLNKTKPMPLTRIVVNLPPENVNGTDLISIVLKICAPSEVELCFFNDIEEKEKKDVITNFSNAFSDIKWSWSTSEKASSEFFSQLWRGVGIWKLFLYVFQNLRLPMSIFFLLVGNRQPIFLYSFRNWDCHCNYHIIFFRSMKLLVDFRQPTFRKEKN